MGKPLPFIFTHELSLGLTWLRLPSNVNLILLALDCTKQKIQSVNADWFQKGNQTDLIIRMMLDQFRNYSYA